MKNFTNTADRVAPEKEATHFLSAVAFESIKRSFDMLTQERLKEVLDYDPESGVFTQKLRTSQRVKVGEQPGCITDGYRIITIDASHYRAARLAFLYMDGYLPENDVDHINQIRDDDRWKNLRHVSRSCNIKNFGNRKDNTSGVKGVVIINGPNKWKAQITVNGKNINLGHYYDFDDAVCARLAAEQCLGWPGCNGNTPAYQYVSKNITGKAN